MGEKLFLQRYIWFDHEIRKERFPNAFKLAEQFEVSVKTAQRSIEYFRERLLAPLEYDVVRRGYYYNDTSFQFPVMAITQEELLALLISRKLITEASAGSLADELGHISQRLGSLIAVNLPGRANPDDAFSFRWKSISLTDPLTFKIVTSALLQGTLLTFSYNSPSAIDSTMRTVEPHHMVNYMGTWHLIAFCTLRNDWRDFVLGRMSLCQVERTVFSIHPRQEWAPFLNDTFGIFQNRGSFDVILRFTPERSRWVRDEVWHEAQKGEIQEDGSLLLTVPVSHEAEIVMEILKHGSHVEVLEPDWLRKKVVKEIMETAKKYQG